jgi:hypothetical protein
VSLEEARALLFLNAPSAWSGNVLVYLLALLWVECERGKVIANNFGNLASAGYAKNSDGNWVEVAWWPGNYWRPGWEASPPTERWADLHARMVAGEAPSAFRAYPSKTAGVRAFVKLLQDSRFHDVIAAARRDSPEAFVQALHDSGYSQDYNAAHVPTFRSLVAEIRGIASGGKPGETGASLLVGAGIAIAVVAIAKARSTSGNKAKRTRT